MSLRTRDPQHCCSNTSHCKNRVTATTINNKRTYVITTPDDRSNQNSSVTLEPRKCAMKPSQHSPACSSLSPPDVEYPESKSPKSGYETEEDLVGCTTVMRSEASGANAHQDRRRKGKSRQTADPARSSNRTDVASSSMTDSATLHDAVDAGSGQHSPVVASSDSDGDLGHHLSNHPSMDTDIQRDRSLGNCADNKNVLFYMNRIESVPDGAKIEVILKEWFGKYDLLEEHHGYIQWLFPTSEKGLNDLSQELKPHEAEFLSENRAARMRFLRAYRLMLDFYGLKLDSAHTGQVSRAANWESRLAHLNRSSHNFMRITRILDCFAELGFIRLQRPLVERLINEVFKTGTLRKAQRSCRCYWVEAVVNEDDYNFLLDLIDKFSKTSSRRY